MIDYNLDFDKLFLVKDSEYGTHVTYICKYPDNLYIDFFTDCDSLDDIIEEIYNHIERILNKND